jgi:hypothetical protein
LFLFSFECLPLPLLSHFAFLSYPSPFLNLSFLYLSTFLPFCFTFHPLSFHFPSPPLHLSFLFPSLLLFISSSFLHCRFLSVHDLISSLLDKIFLMKLPYMFSPINPTAVRTVCTLHSLDAYAATRIDFPPPLMYFLACIPPPPPPNQCFI